MPHTRTSTESKTLSIAPRIVNEYGRLRDAVVSRGGTVVDGAAADEQVARFHGATTTGSPALAASSWRAEVVRQQHGDYLRLLEEQGVRLHHPREIGGAVFSLFTRHTGFVVHDVFIHARMAERSRSWERYGLAPVVEAMENIAEVDDGVVQGGDVLVEGKNVFVGLTESGTNEAGCDALRRLLVRRGARVIPVRCRQGVKRLSHSLAVVSPHTALVHRADLDPLDLLYLEGEFNLIDVPKSEARNLATNVLSIAPDAVVIEAASHDLRRRLRRERLEPIAVPYDEVAKMSGSFHCTTLPLVRD